MDEVPGAATGLTEAAEAARSLHIGAWILTAGRSARPGRTAGISTANLTHACDHTFLILIYPLPPGFITNYTEIPNDCNIQRGPIHRSQYYIWLF